MAILEIVFGDGGLKMLGEKMSFAFLLLVSFFLMGLIGGISVVSYVSFVSENFLEEREGDNLRAIALAHSQHIDTYLGEKMDRVFDFGHDAFLGNRVKEINEVGYSDEAASVISEHIINHDVLQEDEIYEIFVLSRNGRLVGTTNPEEGLGVDFSESVIFREGKEALYIGDFVYDEDFEREGFVVASPMVSEGEFLGVIVFQLSIERLTELIKNMKSFDEINPLGVGKFGDIYLVNKDKLLITPSKFLGGDAKGILLQEVDSLNVDNCFKMEESGWHENHEEVVSFLDFRGEEVIGTHGIIPLTGWCLLVEAERNEVIDNPLRNVLVNIALFSVVLILVFSLVGYLIGRKVDRLKR